MHPIIISHDCQWRTQCRPINDRLRTESSHLCIRWACLSPSIRIHWGCMCILAQHKIGASGQDCSLASPDTPSAETCIPAGSAMAATPRPMVFAGLPRHSRGAGSIHSRLQLTLPIRRRDRIVIFKAGPFTAFARVMLPRCAGTFTRGRSPALLTSRISHLREILGYREPGALSVLSPWSPEPCQSPPNPCFPAREARPFSWARRRAVCGVV